MKYQKCVKKISEALAKYKTEVDNLERSYNAECMNAKKEATKMKGQWTDEYIQKYIVEHRPDANVKARFQSARASVEPVVLDNLERIKKSLDNYFNAPVNPDFTNKIMAIKISGLQLSDLEFKILSESASSYMECRLLNELAETRTRKGKTVSIAENGEGVSKEIDVPNPYIHLDIPNIESIYKEFENYKSTARTLLYQYSGTNAGISHLLDKEVPNYISVSADAYFKYNHEQTFTHVMEKANAILPESKVKRTLTENDKKLIDTLIDSRYPSLAEQKVREIAEADAGIGELFSLDSRYAKYLEE